MEEYALEKIEANFEICKLYLEQAYRLQTVKVKLEIAGMKEPDIDEFVRDATIRAKKLAFPLCSEE